MITRPGLENNPSYTTREKYVLQREIRIERVTWHISVTCLHN